MRKPKTLRGFLKMMIETADFDIYSLKGYEKLSSIEKIEVGLLMAGIQNDLGDGLEEVLQKFNLEWKG